MKKWKKWKRRIALILAGATLLSSIPASAENLFLDGAAYMGEPLMVEEPPVAEEPPVTEEPFVTEELPVTEEPPVTEEIPIDIEGTPDGAESLASGDPAMTGNPAGDAGDLFTDGTLDTPAGDIPAGDTPNGDTSADVPQDGGSTQVPEKTYPTYTSPTLAELGNLAWEEAGAATEVPEAVIPAESQAYNWFFQSFYVQEEDPGMVTKSQDFLLKYQMEFYADCDLDNPFDVVIRIPKTLLRQQNGEESFPVNPAAVGVPRCEFAQDGSRIDIPSPVTPFNYYEETGADGVDYLVFYNYQPIQAGIGTAFQVTYGPVAVTEAQNGTAWSLTPTLQVQGGEPAAYPALTGTIVLPETTPEVTPEATPETTPEATPEVTPEAKPEVTPEVTPEAMPEATPEATPEVTPEAKPEVTPEPETKPEATPEVTPETTPEVTPEVTPEETPEATPEATPEVTPEATPTAAPQAEPTETPEDPTYDPISIADLADLDPETVGAATETGKNQKSGLFSFLGSKDPTWSFDAYYIKQEDPHHIYKETDFSLKYQMEFHTDYDLEKGEVVIKIPQKLLQERAQDGSRLILPSDIAVPQGGVDSEGNYIEVNSRVTPFNYYVDGENLVFYNYKIIKAGTNAAWQVLYKSVDVSRIVNGTVWELTPEITIKKWTAPTEPEAPGEGMAKTTETMTGTPLTGEVHTTAALNGVSKDALNVAGKSYGPGLYTKRQVEGVLGSPLPQEYEENFDKYVYVGWKVSVDVSVVQPVSLRFTDATTYEKDGQDKDGYLVGINIKDIDYYTEEDEAGDRSSRTGIRDIRIVTAYPRDEVTKGIKVKNTFTVDMTLWDDKTVQTKTDDAFWIYEDYYFTYTGDDYQAWKHGGSSYPGWLNVFDVLGTSENAEEEAETYLDAFSFSTQAFLRGYGVTHQTDSTKPGLGERIPGSYYEVETKDGFFAWDTVINGPSEEADRDVTDGHSLHAYSNTGEGGGVPLGAEDFYIKNLSVQRVDQSYDVWEDAPISTPEFDAGEGTVDQTVHVYAAYQQPEANQEPEEWTEICTIPWTVDNHKNGQRVSISNETLKEKGNGQYPIAVRAAYKSISYDSSCYLSFDVQLRHDSPRIKELLSGDDNQEKAITVVNTARNDFSTCQGTGQEAAHLNSLYRSSDAMVSYVGKEAVSDKTARVSTDPINGQVLVDYNLTARSGYTVYSRDILNYLRGKGVEGLLFPDLEGATGKEWIFYDLLPYGLTLDFTKPVIAGRITGIGGNYQDYPQSWDKNGVTVTVDPDTDITPDWKGTHRTLVQFHIKYTGDDPTVYTQGLWLEAWGVSFRARFDWKDLSFLKTDANICAFTPEDPALSLVGAQYGNTEIPGPQNGYDEDYTPFAGPDGIRGRNVHPDVKNILYAKRRAAGDIVVASTSTVRKLVRADDDFLNDFGATAVVEKGKTYTYDISMSSGGTPIQDIAFFDRLEYAVADRTPDDAMDFGVRNDISQVWQGKFVGLDTTEMEKAGITFQAYYSEKQDAARPRRTHLGEEDNPYENPDEVFEKSGDWIRAEEWNRPLSKVKAVAVDLGSYVLPSMESIGFKIQMEAPETTTEGNPYTYNNPSYYCSPENEPDIGEMVVGNSVRVELSQDTRRLEIVKEFEDREEVPGALREQDFTFIITYPEMEEGEEPLPFAYKNYTLHRKDAQGAWKPVDDGQVRTTDKEGKLALHAGEKAVFQGVQEGDRLLLEEEESPFWKSEKEDRTDSQAEVPTRTVTFTNTYRPVLYIQKKTEAVPEDKKGEVKEHTFAFEIKASYIDDKGTKIEQTFDETTTCWLVDAPRTDGGIPNKLDERAFHKEGLLELKPGEIAAVFLESPKSSYTVKELPEKGSNSNDWLCREPGKSGEASVNGSRVEITNTYKWKELLLFKEITHQDKEDVEAARKDLPFTFEVKEVVKEGDKEKEIPVADKEWFLLNTDGSEPKDGERPDKVEEGEAVSGVLDEKGRFTCAMANRKVKIKNLEAGKTYVLYEVDYKAEGEDYPQGTTEEQKQKLGLYQPVNGGTLEVTMPVYSTGKEGSITNDYQMRPLTVSKQVLLGDSPTQGEIGAAKNRGFTMTVKVNGSALANQPYELQKNGQKVSDGVTNDQGRLILKDGESAYIKDAGFLGDAFEVTETPDTGAGTNIRFEQIYPAEGKPSTGTLIGEGGIASFINGSGETLAVMKEYVGGDDKGSRLANKISTDQKLREEFAVEAEFVFYDEHGDIIEPGIKGNWVNQITVIDLATGRTSTYSWPSYERTLTLEPGNMYVFPQKISQQTEGATGFKIPLASYRVTETRTDYGHLYREENEDGATNETWLHIRQKPQGAISGNVKENPLAKLLNEITVPDWTDGTLIEKRMAIDTATRLPQEVTAGAELTLRLEKYQAATKTWLPAAGIPCLQDDRLLYDGSSYNVEAGYEVTDGSYGVTASDGTLTCVKSGETFAYPVVYFPKEQVHLNLYGTTMPDGKKIPEGTLRLVEVPERSDPAWGYLTGYGKAGSLSYSMTITGGTVLYNRTGGSPVEIEKVMATDSDETFTMILKQVLSQSTAPIIKPEHIVESQAVPGISYIVYDRQTGRETGRGQTGRNGEIYLRAGQYARLELSEDTRWTVEEQQSSTTVLEELEGTPDKMTKLSDNLMLIHQPGEILQVGTITYDANGGTFGSEENAPAVQKVSYYMENGKPIPLGADVTEPTGASGKEFEGWYQEQECTNPFYLNTYDCKTDLTVYAKWKKADVKYAVSLYGIEADFYEGGGEDKAGLTFGPAVGQSYKDSYVAHLKESADGHCIHWDSWAEIIAQSKDNPTVYQACLDNGCTKAVGLRLNDQLKEKNGFESNADAEGDGASSLFTSINSSYRKWSNEFSNKGGWPASRMRATLNGKDGLTDVSYLAGEDALTTENCLLTCFPQELQEAIVAKAVKSDTVYNDTQGHNVTTYDKLWLFSLGEYLKSVYDGYRRPNEGTAYAGAKTGGIDASICQENGKEASFLFRTLSRAFNYYIYEIYGRNYASEIVANTTACGIAPGFCIQ